MDNNSDAGEVVEAITLATGKQCIVFLIDDSGPHTIIDTCGNCDRDLLLPILLGAIQSSGDAEVHHVKAPKPTAAKTGLN